MAIVFCDAIVDEETFRSCLFWSDAEEENFFVDKEDNFPSELNDLDLEDKEKVCDELELV